MPIAADCAVTRRGPFAFWHRASQGLGTQRGGPRPFFCLCTSLMHQARKRNAKNGHPQEWPTTVRAVIPFSPANDQHSEIVVYCLDYAIFTVLHITSIGKQAFTVRDLVVNGEFRPSFGVANISDQFFSLRFPMEMTRGSVLSSVLQAPATRITVSSCYPKMPESLVVSTDHGDFTFTALEIISPGGNPPAMTKRCADL